MQETLVQSWARKISSRRDRLPTPVFLGFPFGSPGKESACNAGHLGPILGLVRFSWRSERLGKGKEGTSHDGSQNPNINDTLDEI